MQQRPKAQPRDADTITERIVTSVATDLDVSPTALPPLYTVIDPDAVEAFFQSGAVGRVEFEYHTRTVVVENDGRVTVTDD